MIWCWPDGYKKNFVGISGKIPYSQKSCQDRYSLNIKLLCVELFQRFIYCVGRQAKKEADSERGADLRERSEIEREPWSDDTWSLTSWTFWFYELVNFLHRQCEPGLQILATRNIFLTERNAKPITMKKLLFTRENSDLLLLYFMNCIWPTSPHKCFVGTFVLTLQHCFSVSAGPSHSLRHFTEYIKQKLHKFVLKEQTKVSDKINRTEWTIEGAKQGHVLEVISGGLQQLEAGFQFPAREAEIRLQ